MSRRLARLALVATLVVPAACSWHLHDPVPHADGWHHRPWLVHCETARSHAPDEEGKPGARHARWIWAKTEQGHDVELHGQLEDGFLVVDEIRSSGGGPDDDIPATRAGLRNVCLETLAALDTEVPLELGKVRAARHGEELDTAIVLPGEADAAITRVVVFGDSLSDTGRLKRRLRVFPGAPYWLGRFSNGPNWVDYLEAMTGMAVQNHAYGGAAATHHPHVSGEHVIPLIKEETQFFLTGSLGLQVEDYIDGNLRDGRVQQPRRTVFVIWVGANDYIWKNSFSGEISSFLNSPHGASGYAEVVAEVVAAIAAQVEKLHAAGARNFLLVNLPDLGSSPIVVQNRTYLAPGSIDSDDLRRLEFARRLNALTRLHNDELRTASEALERRLEGASVILQDSAALIEDILEGGCAETPPRTHDLGFDLDSQCTTLGDGTRSVDFQFPCYSGGYLGTSKPEKICAAQRSAVFWDVVHPTSFTHCWQAFFLGQAMNEGGWLDRLPEVDDHREWCARVADRELGQDHTLWMFDNNG